MIRVGGSVQRFCAAHGGIKKIIGAIFQRRSPQQKKNPSQFEWFWKIFHYTVTMCRVNTSYRFYSLIRLNVKKLRKTNKCLLHYEVFYHLYQYGLESFRFARQIIFVFFFNFPIFFLIFSPPISAARDICHLYPYMSSTMGVDTNP